MSIFEALLYGIVQGFTEYLPISSSAHLILLPKFLGTADPGLSFDIFLHVGTLASTLVYFWKDWARLLPIPQMGFAQNDRLFGLKFVVVGTLPGLIAGALLHHAAETTFRATELLAVTLTLGGWLLWGMDRFRPRDRTVDEAFQGVTLKDTLWIGIGQCLALVPGMSRSGSTILTARFLKFDRTAAARLSFLLSAPITAAAIVFDLRHWQAMSQESIGAAALAAGLLASFAGGMAAIWSLMKLLRNASYLGFAVYRTALALFLLWRFVV